MAEPALPATNAFARTIGGFRRYPEFRFLWAGNLSFFTGVWMQTLVLGWVTYELTNSEFLFALFSAARLSSAPSEAKLSPHPVPRDYHLTRGDHRSFQVTRETPFCYHPLLCAANSGARTNRFSIRG